MYQYVLRNLRPAWRRLIVTDLTFRALAFVVLTPAVSALFHLFVRASGREVLADADIVRFFVHPLGWLTIILVGGAAIGIYGMELVALMTIMRAARKGDSTRTIAALEFVWRHKIGILRLTMRFAGRVLLTAAPFLAAGGALYVYLLTEHDINFYLSYKPPAFWGALALIGGVLTAMIAFLSRLAADFGLAVPLHVFEQVDVRKSYSESRRRMHGLRGAVIRSIAVWFAINLAIPLIGVGAATGLGRLIMPFVRDSLTGVLLLVGFIVLLQWIIGLGASVLASITFAGIIDVWYNCLTGANLQTHDDVAVAAPLNLHLTRFRLLAGTIVGVLVSALIGVFAVQSALLNDRTVEITAHRGGALSAPENTLAAIERGIADGADWIEIDVQETKDGEIIVAHDSDLMKVAQHPVKIWEATAEELRRFDVGSYFDPQFKNERLPTLAEVLELCRGKAKVNIELKYYGHNDRLEQRVIDLVEALDMADEVVLMSLEAAMVKTSKKLRPAWTVGLLTAVSAGDVTRTEADFFAVSTKLATPELIRSAHAQNKKVYVWTVNDRLAMSTMIGRGADNLITDAPALAREVIAERARMSPIERLLVDQASWLGGETIQTTVENEIPPDEIHRRD